MKAFFRTEEISESFSRKTDALLAYINSSYLKNIFGSDPANLNLLQKMKEGSEFDRKMMDKEFDAIFKDNISSASSDEETN